MPTPTKGPRLGGSPAHQRHMLANLATALFEHGKITTTEARARRLRPVAERLITFAKRGDMHARRQVLATVTDRDIVHTLFAEIGPSFVSRDGGYTRITKIGPRKGDNAPLAVIELVAGDAEMRPRRRRARRAQPPAGPRRADADAAPEAVTPEAVTPEAVTPEAAAPLATAAGDTTVTAEDRDTEPVRTAAGDTTVTAEDRDTEPVRTAAGDTTVTAEDRDTEPVRTAAGEPTGPAGSADEPAQPADAVADPGDQAGSEDDQPQRDQPEDSGR